MIVAKPASGCRRIRPAVVRNSVGLVKTARKMNSAQSPDVERPFRSQRRRPRRHALTGELLNEAAAMRDSGEEGVFAIDNPRGLFIRVRNGAAAYYVQARGSSKVLKRKICAIRVVKIVHVKQIAADAIKAIKRDRDVDVVIEAGLKKAEPDEVARALDKSEAIAKGFWSFRNTIDKYTGRTVVRNGIVQSKLSSASIREINDRLRDRPEAAALMDQPVNSLRDTDFEEVRDKIAEKQVAGSPPAKFIDLSKRVLSWGAKYHRRNTGLDTMSSWWSRLAHEYKPGDRKQRFLTTEQVGMLLALLQAVRQLDNRGNDSVFGALELMAIAAQRSAATVGVQALASDRWKDDPLEPGWRVYSWEAQEVKGKRPTKLSLPPEAIDIIKRVADCGRKATGLDSRWAFPQTRDKYALLRYAESGREAYDGQVERLDGHITASALNHALDALAGLKPGWPNLLEFVGLPGRIGPQDFRRTIATFFENRGLGSYASALLDHKVTGTDKMSEQVAAITQDIYSAADRVLFKTAALKMWLGVLLPCWESAKSDPRLKQAVALRQKTLDERERNGISKRVATLAAKRNEQLSPEKRCVVGCNTGPKLASGNLHHKVT